MNTISYFLPLAGMLVLTSCTKSDLIDPITAKGDINVQAEIKKYDYFACTGTDADGNQFAGRRCGTPNGSACKRVESGCTPLRMMDPNLDPMASIINLSAKELSNMWSTPEGRKKLSSLGIKEFTE